MRLQAAELKNVDKWLRGRWRGAQRNLAFLAVCWLTLFTLSWIVGCRNDAPSHPPNIVLIVLDTVRADHLSSYGYHRATTPHIDAVAARGTLFLGAHSVAPYTRASTASILSGAYPSVHGAITHADSIAQDVPMLAEQLQHAGYRTAGIYRNGNVSDKFGFGRGFDSYLVPDKAFHAGRRREGRPVRYLSEFGDELLTREALAYFENLGAEKNKATDPRSESPFFLYLHLGGAHAPYTPPDGGKPFVEGPLTPVAAMFYEESVKVKRTKPSVIQQINKGLVPLDERTREQTVALYDSELAFADAQVGEILEALANSDLSDDTVVMITADHGEEFWDHGGLNHGHSHYEELLRVPLVVAGPGVGFRQIEQAVSLIDVTPTLLDFAGVEPPPELPGRSLVPVLVDQRRDLSSRAVYAEGLLHVIHGGEPVFFRSLMRDDHKLILDFQHHKKLAFDLDQDPREMTNLIAAPDRDQAVVEEARQMWGELLEIHGSNLERAGSAQAAVEIPPELEQDLRALGYVGSSSDSASTDSLFRRPLRMMDMEALGFVGHEVDGASYGSAVDFSRRDHSPEQLLYGWGNLKPDATLLRFSRKAGVRLARTADHRAWRLEGFLPRYPGRRGSLDLAVRVDGGKAESFSIDGVGAFEISGTLPAAPTGRGAGFVRFDFECSFEVTAKSGVRTDDSAPCATMHRLELR